MQNVFTNSQTCHKWASQSQMEGHTSNGNIFFEGPVIYSYGHHFPMGVIHKPKTGYIIALHTTEGYSVTTAGHKSLVRQATSHIPSYEVPDIGANGEINHKVNIAYYEKEAKETAERAKRAISQGRNYLDILDDILMNLRDYKEDFSAPEGKCFSVSDFLTDEDIEKINSKEAKSEERAENRAAKARAKADFNLAKWIKGEAVSTWNFSLLPPALRINKKKKEVETSHGASVPLKEALLLYKAILSGQDITGAKIGGFTVGSYEEGILTIGCHNIDRGELDRTFGALV